MINLMKVDICFRGNIFALYNMVNIFLVSHILLLYPSNGSWYKLAV